MAAHRPTAADKWLLRTGSLLVIGAIPVSAGLAHPAVAAAQVSAPAVVSGRNDTAVTRPIPDGTLAPVDPSTLHLPDPAALAPPIAPIQAPGGTLRIGSVIVPRPDIIDAPTGAQINTAAAGTEAALAQGLDSAGFAPSRSDRIAADTLGDAATGAMVGSTLSSPIASTSALIGAVTGVVVGLPFAPIGLLIGPVACAAIGYGVIAAPAAAVGAAIGAAVGVAQGVLAPAMTSAAAPAPRAH